MRAVDSVSRPVKVLELGDQLSPQGVTQAIEETINRDQGGGMLRAELAQAQARIVTLEAQLELAPGSSSSVTLS